MQNFTEFLNKNNGKKIVGVQGLGFVGAIMSLVIANCKKEDYAVIGIDKNEEIVRLLNDGELHISSSDPKVKLYFEKAMRNKNFFISSDPIYFSSCDIIIIDINLDVKKDKNFIVNKDYSVTIEPFKNAIRSIGMYCKEDVLIIIETTVPPGTSKNIVYPILTESLRKRKLDIKKIKLGHSYERVMPGPNYINSIENFPRAYSGINELSKAETAKFLTTIINTEKHPLQPLSNTNSSETAKVLENSYRAMNIAFIDEWSKFAEISNVDLFEVIDTIKIRPTHKNIMYPGFGVGGYCLTKDPLLASWAAKNFFKSVRLKQSEKAVIINDKMPLHLIDKINQIKIDSPAVLVMGISYLKDVGDMRFSPFLTIEKKLKNLASSVMTFDPFIKKNEYKSNSWEEIVISNFDLILIGSPHSIFLENHYIEKICKLNKAAIIIDPFNLAKKLEINNRIITIGNGL